MPMLLQVEQEVIFLHLLGNGPCLLDKSFNVDYYYGRGIPYIEGAPTIV